MSSEADAGGSKKAVHVKWAGKTIALGTFPSAEADEKCARAKALTRAWRSTIRPKPTREWVMNELERLGVRVVSGKLGRKADEDDSKSGAMPPGAFPPGEPGGPGGLENFAQERLEQQRRASNMGLDTSAGGIAAGGGTLGGMPAANPDQPVNQHYEMLKLHHMNLLQELHETTMMMNMYQQQQLQQEQLRLQQQQVGGSGGGSSSNNDQMGGVMPQRQGSLSGGMDQLFGNGGGSGLSQRGSLGLGMGPRGSLGLGAGMGGALGQRGSLGLGGGGGLNGSQLKPQMEARIEAQASMLKHDQSVKEAAQSGLAGLKRNQDDRNDLPLKRPKVESEQDNG